MRNHINEKVYLCYGLCKVQDWWRWQWLGLQQRRSLRWYRPNLRETSWMQTNQQKKTGARCVCYSGQLLFSNWFNANVLTTRPCIYLLFRGRILMTHPPPPNAHPLFIVVGRGLLNRISCLFFQCFIKKIIFCQRILDFLSPPWTGLVHAVVPPQGRFCPGRVNWDLDMCSFKVFLVLKKTFSDYDFMTEVMQKDPS